MTYTDANLTLPISNPVEAFVSQTPGENGSKLLLMGEKKPVSDVFTFTDSVQTPSEIM